MSSAVNPARPWKSRKTAGAERLAASAHLRKLKDAMLLHSLLNGSEYTNLRAILGLTRRCCSQHA